MEPEDKFIIDIKDLVSEDITIDLSSYSAVNTTYAVDNMNTITIASGSIDTSVTTHWSNDGIIDLSNIDNIFGSVEWESRLPDLDKVNSMCEEYPALAKAFENFKTVYKMVEQDYIGKLKERGE